MHLACYDRNHRLCGLNIYFSQFWKLGSSRLRSLQIQCLVRPLPTLKLFIFSLCLHMVDRVREITFLMSLLRKALIPFMWAPPSWTDYFPKGRASKYQHIHDWLSNMNLHFTNLHSIALLTGIPLRGRVKLLQLSQHSLKANTDEQEPGSAFWLLTTWGLRNWTSKLLWQLTE